LGKRSRMSFGVRAGKVGPSEPHEKMKGEGGAAS
jgi:hypothetical protein